MGTASLTTDGGELGSLQVLLPVEPVHMSESFRQGNNPFRFRSLLFSRSSIQVHMLISTIPDEKIINVIVDLFRKNLSIQSCYSCN